MRLLLTSIFLFQFLFNTLAQHKFSYEPFEYVDVIDSIAPLSGQFKRLKREMIIESGTFKNGIMIGNWKSFSTEGKLVKDIYYKNGTLDSTFKTYYFNGNPKLSGSFINGLRNGKWEYFNAEGKLQWTTTYDKGKPIGTSDFYDQRGKLIKYSFSHDSHQFIKTTSNFLLNEQGLCESSETGEWFFYWDPKTIPYNAAHGLDRKSLDAELIRNNLEIPAELFNTYFNEQYLIRATFLDYTCTKVEVIKDYDRTSDFGLLDFIAQTNDQNKLKHPETNELSLVLLQAKLNEVFMCFQPWSLANGEMEFVFLFNLNDFD